MNTAFGLTNLWTEGDVVIRTTFMILVAMSIASWLVILIKALDIWRTKRLGARIGRFWHASDLAEGMSKLGNARDNPFRLLAIEGREAMLHHRTMQGQLHDSLSANDWISRGLRSSIDMTTARMQSGLTLLASVGSTAPFVGLFGTVWGIYHALMKIAGTGSASIDQVAGPIGEALIMTALGLATAIPAVLGYNAVLRGNKNNQVKLGRFAGELHAYFLTGSRVNGTSAAPKVVTMKKNEA